MAYIKNTWATGDTITAAKMNNIEDGIEEAAQSGGGALICNSTYTGETYVLDKTAQEIYDALLAGTPAYIKYQYGSPEVYMGELYLAPIIRFSNYNYTNDMHIYASRPSVGYVQQMSAVGLPGTIAYSATSMNAYPTYYRGSRVPEGSMTLDSWG